MSTQAERPRRRFLQETLGAGAALVLAAAAGPAAGAKKKEPDEDDVSPTEDLMREHGVLRRLLLVYGEVVHRVDSGDPKQDLKPETLAHAAQMVRVFIEDYHERDEEEYIFPRFQKAGVLTDLVAVLLQQHRAGRTMTATVQRLATPSALSNPGNRRELADAMRRFVRMYEPHAAREDTILFPAFRKLISEKELHALMEAFEQKEKSLPSGDFEKMVADVAAIEQAYGIYDLAQFVPAPARP